MASAFLDDAVLRVGWYRRRRLMEIFFRIVKSGCRVEAPQLAAVERLERALVIYLVIAWRILYLLVPLGRDCLSPALRGCFHPLRDMERVSERVE